MEDTAALEAQPSPPVEYQAEALASAVLEASDATVPWLLDVLGKKHKELEYTRLELLAVGEELTAWQAVLEQRADELALESKQVRVARKRIVKAISAIEGRLMAGLNGKTDGTTTAGKASAKKTKPKAVKSKAVKPKARPKVKP